MISTLDDFIKAYTKVCDMGWIKTHRSGPTGIGKTLEDLLGIAENNIDGPDFGDYELKSGRLDSNSMLTIFTKTPQPKGAAHTLRMTFGYSSAAYDNEEKVLHATLSANRFVSIANTGRRLKIRKLQVQVGHSHSRNSVPNPSVTVGTAGFYRERGCRNRQVA